MWVSNWFCNEAFLRSWLISGVFFIPRNVVFHFSDCIIQFPNFNNFYFSFSTYNTFKLLIFDIVYLSDEEQNQYWIYKTLCKSQTNTRTTLTHCITQVQTSIGLLFVCFVFCLLDFINVAANINH